MTDPSPLRIGTRGSPLALAQAHEVRDLLAAADRQPSQRVYRLLATAEERDSGSTEAVRNWLMSAASAPPDPAWLCDKCGDAAAEWSARCEACGGFDSLAWKLPPTPAHLSAIPVTTPLRSNPSKPSIYSWHAFCRLSRRRAAR